MTDLIIIGTGDFAEVAFYFLKESNLYNIVAFAVEKAFQKEFSFCDKPIYVVEELNDIAPATQCYLFIAIGPNQINTIRERVYEEMKTAGYNFIKFIHPSAVIWDSSVIGENTIIFPNVVVEPFAIIGNNCVIWSGSIVSHHAIIEDNCFVAPGVRISGRTRIGKNCFLGINSTIREKIVVAERCIIGAGSVIKKNTIKNGVYSEIGTPFFKVNSIAIKL